MIQQNDLVIPSIARLFDHTEAMEEITGALGLSWPCHRQAGSSRI